MAGMDDFANDLADAVINETPIGIFADFDVDGATSAAILTRFLRHFDIAPPVYIPDRLTEGYGPSVLAMQSLKDQGAEIILMADCGITAFDPLQAAHDMGLKVCVFDHHEPENKLPTAWHIINPKRSDDVSGMEMLAACGVCFMVCVAINKALRAKGYYKGTQKQEAPLKSWLDLVALGTVCDMVPLTGVNRLFVKVGFEQMRHQNNEGINALCLVGKVENIPDPKDAGWSLGPRINAGSRVHRSDLGAKLLSTDDLEEAQSIAFALEDCNRERRAIQSTMMQNAQNKVEFLGGDCGSFIMVEDEDFHPGLSGLVAGQLVRKYNKPAIVVTYTDIGGDVLEGRGSGRSIKGVNMADIFISAKNAGVIEKGGGHAMAGGFTVLPDKIEAFKKFIASYIDDLKMEKIAIEPLNIDAIATVRGAKPDFIHLLNNNIGPFGMGNAEPVFALSGVRVFDVDVLKEKHIRLMISDAEGGSRMKAMFFGGVGTPLGDMLMKNYRVTPFHLAGQFQLNHWQGRTSVEFHIMDGVNAILDGQQQLAG
jgi:single-stranded-DNA-specific exonuclease